MPVGIIKDFNNETLRNTIKPTVIRGLQNPQYGNMLVRISRGTTKRALAGIQRLWDKFYPEKAFQFSWVDESLAAQYKTEQKLQQLFAFFSLLVVFLACLGLFGLAAFTAEQRVKEIGIRKVLGGICSKYHLININGFFEISIFSRADCISDCLVCHEQMVAGFCLPDQYTVVGIRFSRFCRHPYRFCYRKFSICKSRNCQPS